MSDDKAEIVARAMEALRPMLGTLTGYARAMLGEKSITVQVGPTTQTDGRRIMIRPPLALAELGEHDRQACGRRNDHGVLVCPTCSAREDILVKMRHEIGHVLHGSFEKFSPQPKVLESMAADSGLESAAIRLRSRTRAAALLDIAELSPNPHLPTVTMILEDIRIDRANADTSDGGAEIYRVFLERTLAQGADGDSPAIERPFADQVLLGLLTVPHGVDVTGLLTEEAQQVVADSEVQKILGTRHPRSRDVLGDAYRLLRRLIDLGVLPDPEREEEQENEEQDPGEQENEEQDDETQSEEDADGQAQGDEGTGEPAASDELEGQTDQGQGEGEQDADADRLRQVIEEATGHAIDLDGDFEVPDDVLRRLVDQIDSQIEHLGDFHHHLGGVNIYGRRRKDGRGDLFGVSRIASTLNARTPSEALLGSLTGRARVVFADNAMVNRQRNATRGRVSPTVLGKRAWNPDDQRLFERRQRNDAPSYSVLIGMDNSGSTASGIIATTLRETTLAAATMCQRVGVEVSIYAHTTGQRTVDLYEIKSPDAPWSPRIAGDLRGLSIGATNFDGSTMAAYRRILAARPATRKVLLYFTDGRIPGSGGEPEAQIMRQEVVECRRQGITLLGVGAHTSSPERFDIPTVRLDRVEDVRKVLEFLAKEFGV